MKNLVLRLSLLIVTVIPALAYRDLETGTFLTRDPAGFVDGPNLYAYVQQNPWTAFDPDGLDAEKIGENKYRYTLRPDLNPQTNPDVNIKGSHITNVNDNFARECATGAQFTHGTVKSDGPHDVPSTGTWKRGDPVSGDTKPGTMVARGWTQNEKGEWTYPSMSISQWQEKYGKDVPINHVGSLEKIDDKKGTVTIQDQYDTPKGQMDSRTYSQEEGWYEVNGNKPYDAEPSESAVVPKPADSDSKRNQQNQQSQQNSPTQSARDTRQQTDGQTHSQTQNQNPQSRPDQRNRRN